MKLNEFIERLKRLQEKVGDAEVLIREDGFGGHSMHKFGSVRESEISVYEIEDADTKEVFQDWDGEEDLTVLCIEITAGTRLYTT